MKKEPKRLNHVNYGSDDQMVLSNIYFLTKLFIPSLFKGTKWIHSFNAR
jgi:hypothetical protein